MPSSESRDTLWRTIERTYALIHFTERLLTGDLDEEVANILGTPQTINYTPQQGYVATSADLAREERPNAR